VVAAYRRPGEPADNPRNRQCRTSRRSPCRCPTVRWNRRGRPRCARLLFTTVVGSITNGHVLRRCLSTVDSVIHAATLHKPHIATHDRQAFVDPMSPKPSFFWKRPSLLGYGASSSPAPPVPSAGPSPLRGASVWITEDVTPVPRNVYGSPRRRRRTSANSSTGTMTSRRPSASAATSSAPPRLSVPTSGPSSCMTPPGVVRRLLPDQESLYGNRGWTMFPGSIGSP